MGKELTVIEQKEVDFYGDDLTAVKADDGSIYVSIRHMAQALGMNIQAQTRRIERHPVLSDGYTWVAIMATQQRRWMYMLRVDLVPFWLATIDTIRLNDEIRPKMERFQKEAARVLWDAFQQGQLTADPNFSDLLKQDTPAVQAYKTALAVIELAKGQILLEAKVSDHARRLEAIEAQLGDTARAVSQEQASQISQAVKAVAISQGKLTKRNEFGSVYGEMYRKFGITSYRMLPAGRFQEAMDWLTEWYQTLSGEDVPF
jgi:hypothetical protein